ncbi:MAG TPA: cyclic nucleotide-binding domain-containing protein [Thermoanaerobaculia bacterium]
MASGGQGTSETDYFVQLQTGEYVFQQGDAGNSMFIIEDGLIEIIKTVDSEERKLAELEQGDFFGEMSVLDDQPREASARAGSECQLLRIDKSMFDQMLRQNPEIAVRMLRKLARRLRNVIADSFEHHEQAPAPAPAPAPASPVPAVAGEPEAAAPPPSAPETRTFRMVFEEGGEEIVLPEKHEITVGRPDPVTGTVPDINLTAYDTARSVSRRHAKLFREDDQFFVCEEIGTANGTFVNSERVKTGIRVLLADNDVVSFGRVAMVFRAS